MDTSSEIRGEILREPESMLIQICKLTAWVCGIVVVFVMLLSYVHYYELCIDRERTSRPNDNLTNKKEYYYPSRDKGVTYLALATHN